MENNPITVSEFHSLVNQTLEFAYSLVVVEGEVASYKVNQGKWVFFDLKDDESVVSCFIPIFQLKTPLEDGMLVRVSATPNLTKWGKFSLTVKAVELAGEGTVKRAFEMLKAQFEKEGLFASERKRALPEFPTKVALITSKQAAAYNDFMTILNDRWGGVELDHYQVQVQGASAPDSIVAAIAQVNQNSDYDVLVLIRGGGSAEDLQAFNTEEVVRAVFGSQVHTLVGIGHEDDVTLAELVADVRAATPTDAARRLVPDKKQIAHKISALSSAQTTAINEMIQHISRLITRFEHAFGLQLQSLLHYLNTTSERLNRSLDDRMLTVSQVVSGHKRLLHSLDPENVLARGYSITRVGKKVITSAAQVRSNDKLVIQLHKGEIIARSGSGSTKKHVKPKDSQTTIQL